MATQPVPRPVEGCETCRRGYQSIVSLYRMWMTCPDDPGAQGTFEAAREDYEKHHQENHKPESEAASC